MGINNETDNNSCIAAGCDVGSLTAKAVLLRGNTVLASSIIRVKPTARQSADAVMHEVLSSQGLRMEDIDFCCSTGYGRLEIPFAGMNMSEISCHGMGAYWTDSSIRTIIDIGGQDCKVISIDDRGMVTDFIMNDKCAAGTGRSLEMLARTIGVPLEKLGPLSAKSRRPLVISNKCSIFMELEVIDALYRRKKLRDIAGGLSDAVARRAVSLAKSLIITPQVCVTGGVSKNQGVLRQIEKLMAIRLKSLTIDPQLMGALGAAVFAVRALTDKKDNKEATIIHDNGRN